MTGELWFVLAINPEPWAIGDLSVGRKGGKVFPYVGRNSQLYAYQQAVKELVKEQLEPGFEMLTGNIELGFYFWRKQDVYKSHQARTQRKHEADVTNLQKATEDALQGVVFANDKDVDDIYSRLVEQGENVTPRVVIVVKRSEKFQPEILPQHVLDRMDDTPDLFSAPDETSVRF